MNTFSRHFKCKNKDANVRIIVFLKKKKPYNVYITCALDVDVDKPDEKSIMTYVAQFLKHHPDSVERGSVRNEEEVWSVLLGVM